MLFLLFLLLLLLSLLCIIVAIITVCPIISAVITVCSIIILLNQNNYAECLNIDNNAAKRLNILAINLNVLHNYFRICIFLNFYISAKSFSLCNVNHELGEILIGG